LRDAGVTIDAAHDVPAVLQLPTWKQVTDLYYFHNTGGDGGGNSNPEPVVVGLDRCEEYRTNVPPGRRFLGVAGNFNSGTTAFGMSLQANCRFPPSEQQHDQEEEEQRRRQRRRQYHNNRVSNVGGMLNQVPWAKHKMAQHRYNHTIVDGVIPAEDVLPVVLIRDPYYWMQSMCREGYGVRWDHTDRHCPNLVPYTDYDKRKQRQRQTQRGQQQQQQQHPNDPNITSSSLSSSSSMMQSMPVWMGKNIQSGPSWDSLIHYWNDWYQSYYDARWPRLMVRFEDTLYQPRTTMELVCSCGGGTVAETFRYVLGEAKPDHRQEQNDRVGAMVKYGTSAGRYHNLTDQDITFVRRHVNATLLSVFQYRY
jgi:hypothetical protein